MLVKIVGGEVSGSVKVPSSKSFAHRQLIASFLSKGKTDFLGDFNVGDIETTIDCLKQLGLVVSASQNRFTVQTENYISNATLNVKDSGSTLRFLIPVCAALGIETTFVGAERLKERPIKDLLDELKKHGIAFSSDKLPIKLSGKLIGGNFEINGGVSSQYITGLLLALPIIEGEKTLSVIGNIVSKDYVKITLGVLKQFNVEVKQVITQNITKFIIDKNQKYNSVEKINCEGDFSAAGFFIVLGVLCGNITIKGLNKDSIQGDKIIIDTLKSAGANIKFDNDLIIEKSDLKAITFDAQNYPDVVPILAVALANAKGQSIIKNIERLRQKESDRVEEIIKMLKAFNIHAEYSLGNLIIEGGIPKKAEFNCPQDHRIAMASTVLAMKTEGESILNNVECVKKSYAQFFEHLALVGGKICVE